MCVIILKQPGVVIPRGSIEQAVRVNDDGFGLAYPNKGRLVVHRQYEPKGLDPAVPLKMLESLKDQLVLLHFRIKTKGQKDTINCHPFTSATFEEDGADVVIAHNGTLSSFGDATHSDTYIFNEEIVKPLVKRELSLDKTKVPFGSQFAIRILEAYAGSYNKFCLIDGNNHFIIINKGLGKEFDNGGWWASNEHSVTEYKQTSSFWNRTQRYDVKKKIWVNVDDDDDEDEKSSLHNYDPTDRSLCGVPFKRHVYDTTGRKIATRHYDEYGREYQIDTRPKRAEDQDNVVPFDGKGRAATSVPLISEKTLCGANSLIQRASAEKICQVRRMTLALLNREMQRLRQKVGKAMQKPRLNKELLSQLTEERPTFLDVSGLSSYDDLTRFEMADIIQIVKETPFSAATLLADLIEINMVRRQQEKAREISERVASARTEAEVKEAKAS